ncbi:MAG: HEAT repeat domain-containing protein [Desulfobaccales bacterium]
MFDNVVAFLGQTHYRPRRKLQQALQDQNWLVRRNAAEALGKIGSPEAVPILTKALQDSDEPERWQAAEALAKIGSPEAVSAAIQALQDPEWHVKMRAAEALGRIGTLDILKQLIQTPDVDFSDRYSFYLARKLAIRFCKKTVDFIPVYPEIIERYRGKRPHPKS